MFPSNKLNENMKAAFSAAFEKVSPICKKIVNNCTSEDLTRLESCIADLDPESLAMLQDYLLFPFRLLLCKKENEKIMIGCVHCMTVLFERLPIASWSTFSDTFLLLFVLITVPGDINKRSDASEEMKTSVCQCVFQLMRNAPDDILLKIFSSTFRLPLAQAFYTLLELLKHEKSKLLQKSILRTIGVLIYSPRYFTNSIEIETLAEENLVVFLPGLSKSLSLIISGDVKQGHGVTVLSINIFSDILSLLLKDSSTFGSTKTLAPSEKENSDHTIPSVIRNNTWVNEVSGNINILIQNIVAVTVNHEHWKVRLAFLEFANEILIKCPKNLSNCIPGLLRAVFALSVDNYKQVESFSNDVVFSFSQMLNKDNSNTLLSIIEDDLYAISSQLVMMTLSSNDSQKLTVLKAMQGYVLVLVTSLGLRNFLRSVPHLERILLSLLNVTEFDCSSVNLMEEVTMSSDFDSSLSNLWPRKSFKYYDDYEIAKRVISICYILGSDRNNAKIVIDFLLEKIKTSNEYSLQCIFLISNVIKGFSQDFKSSDVHSQIILEENFDLDRSNEGMEIVEDVLNELFSSQNWDATLSSFSIPIEESSSREAKSLCSLNASVFEVCLTLEVVAVCAQVFKSHFKKFLITILCPIMEKAGTANLVISQSAKVCLHSIALFCGFKTISKLIKDNSDYIVNSVMLNFFQFVHKPEASVVLRVALEESEADVLLLFKDPIVRLFSVLDYNQEMAFSLLKILLSFVKAIHKWYPSKKSKNALNQRTQAKANFRAAFLEHHRLRQIEMSYTQEVPDEITEIPNASEIENDTTDEKSLPLYVEIVREILTRCVHLLSSKDLNLRILTLEVIELSALALTDFNDELLPLVHNLWNPFVKRFSESPIVALQAYKTLLVMADECRDFIRVRAVKDIFPEIINFLNKQGKLSLSKSNIKSYKCTAAYKFQECTLSGIGRLASKIEVSEKDFSIIVSTCLPYLNDKQPRPLREAASKTIKALVYIDADAMWCYYKELYSEEKTLLPPDNSLYPVNFPQSDHTLCGLKFNF